MRRPDLSSALTAAVLATLWATTGTAAPAAPALPVAAHRVTSTAQWASTWHWASADLASSASYDWVSDHEVLFFRVAGKVIKPVSLDTRTRRQTPLPFMDAAWAEWARAQGSDEAPSSIQASISPDGKRLYWTVNGFDSLAVFAADVDGPRRFEFGYSGGPGDCPTCLWLGDSQELVSFHTDAKEPSARVVRLDKPSLGLDTAANSVGVLGPVGPHGPVCVTPDHRILSDDWSPGGPPTATVHVMQATFAPQPKQGMTTGTATITLPPGTTAAEMLYSPQGDRIAWSLRSPHGTWTTLWVCRVDGTGWRKILSVPDAADNTPASEVTGVRWLPSGKAISFLCRNTLWTVSVPGSAP